jgi:4-hydroxybenzoate polyprenyltransferase
MRAWGELLRLPNLFTVPGEALAGFALATGGLSAKVGWACLAVLLTYAGGLLLNDWFDREQDAEERPERPLPSGRVRPAAARNVGLAALAAGVAVAWLAGPLQAGIAAGLTALCALLYDAGLKRTAAGPGLMGLSRAGALAVGAGFAGSFGVPVVVAAVTLFAYTAMLTYVARDETAEAATDSDAWALPVVLASGGVAMSLRVGVSIPGVAVLLLAVLEAARIIQRMRSDRRETPAAIGRLVRVMIVLQAAWVVWPPHAPGRLAALAAMFVALRAAAEVAGRAFYGS